MEIERAGVHAAQLEKQEVGPAASGAPERQSCAGRQRPAGNCADCAVGDRHECKVGSEVRDGLVVRCLQYGDKSYAPSVAYWASMEQPSLEIPH
jgi:hypothetical protein